MEKYIKSLIDNVAKNAFESCEYSESNFVVIVDLGMNDFSVVDYDTHFTSLIEVVSGIEGSSYIVDRDMGIEEFIN